MAMETKVDTLDSMCEEEGVVTAEEAANLETFLRDNAPSTMAEIFKKLMANEQLSNKTRIPIATSKADLSSYTTQLSPPDHLQPAKDQVYCLQNLRLTIMGPKERLYWCGDTTSYETGDFKMPKKDLKAVGNLGEEDELDSSAKKARLLIYLV